MTAPRKSPLSESHSAAGAKLVHFAGCELPIYFTGILEEHRAVRRSVGIFDLVHLGELHIFGPGAASTIRRLVTVDPMNLPLGEGRYALALTPAAGIADDLFVYRLGADEFWLVPNGANRDKIRALAEEYAAPQTIIDDITESTALIAVQGPRALELLAKAGGNPRELTRKYSIRRQSIAGRQAWVSLSGYTGEPGVELYLNLDDATAVWELLRKLGEKFDLLPCGLGARDTLRLEMCYPLWGNDINEHTNPIEAGLMFAVDLSNEDFTGRSSIVGLKAGPVARKLCALDVKAGIPRQGSHIYMNDKMVGSVTSGTFSPSLGHGIAIGYVQSEFSVKGSVLQIDVRGKIHPATVTAKPFYRKENA